MSDIVISVEGLWKQYRYGVLSHRALYKDLQSWWARFHGKEDPNVPISFKSSPITHHPSPASNDSDRFWALKDVSFEVKRGEVLGIIGKNGAGKSTLLKIMSRVTTPTKGQIKIKGRVASLLEVGTGFHPELTGRENIFLNGAILGMTKDEIKRKFDEIVAYAEINKFIDTPVKRYSSGMYVRLAFAVAAHLEPEILVVDEVLAVGDAAFQKKCLGKMGDIAKEGRTVLFVSHNMNAVEGLCTRGLLLDAGTLFLDGRPSDAIGMYLSQGDVPIKQSGGRRTGPLGIHSVRFLNAHSHPTTEVWMGEGCQAEVVVDAECDTDAPYIGISLYDDAGHHIFSFNSLEGGFSPLLSKGLNTLVLSIPSLPLLPGAYHATVVVLTPDRKQSDLVSRALALFVHPADLHGSGFCFTPAHGLIYIKHSWVSRVNKGRTA
jgi:lipopolysaccharide transport system ATP-binding protein